MNFTEIDLKNWPRGQMFYYFSKMAPTSYSLTVDVDVTDLLEKLKACGRKFFPTYLWLTTKCLNKQSEFKIAYKDGKIGYYDVLTPLYASFHEDDKTFSMMWTAYDENYETFYTNYLKNQEEYGANHGVLAQPETPPPANAYTVSTLPWISFKHFAVHTHDNKEYFFPSVEAGKIYESAGAKVIAPRTMSASDFAKAVTRKLLPLSLTCHHATTDGYHLDRFLKDFDEEAMCLIKRL